MHFALATTIACKHCHLLHAIRLRMLFLLACINLEKLKHAQTARSITQDFEMEQKIDLEIRLRELAAQSMLEAQDEIDVLEVEKSLLTSDQRMNCYASLLEEQRKQLSNPSLSTADSGRGSKSGHHRSPSRPDLIGANGTGAVGATTTTSGVASSPSFSSSVSNSQSPSKLSPVSGQSANSPSFTTNSSQHSRQLGLRSQSSAHNNTTLSAKQRAKNKQRELLMQKITSLSNINCNMAINNRASVSVSEIRIPLMWRDVDHFKNRGDYKRFAIFCLLKIDSQIYDTQLICDVDRQVTDVTFDDLVVFNEIEHNFELGLEVYTCVYLEQFSLSSTPRKLKEKLTSSVSRAMGRRLATQTASVNYTKELQAYDKSYRFALIANATLRLSDASDSVKTYDLVLASPGAHNRHYQGDSWSHRTHGSGQPMDPASARDADKNTLPLFGHFCCKLLVRPDVFDKNIKTGYLRVATISLPNNNTIGSAHNSHSGSSDRMSESPSNTNNEGSCSEAASDSAAKLRSSLAAASSRMASLSMSTSRVHWGLLRNFTLHLWPIEPQDLELALQRGELPLLDNPQKPRLSLTIDRYTRLLRVSNSSLTIETDKGCFVLGVYSPETSLYGALNHQADEISHWLRSIEQLIYDSHIWGSVLSHYPPHTSTRLANNKRTNGSKQKQHYYASGGAVLHADL